MPRSKVYVHVTDQNGILRRTDKGGREVFGLHYHRTTRKDQQPERGVYYIYQDDKRIYLGADLSNAIEQVETPTLPVRRARTHERDARVLETWHAASPRAQDQAATALTAADDRLPTPSTECLSTCRDVWRDDKQAKRCRASYVAETVRVFGEFIAIVGDKPVNQITKSDFVAFERYMIQGATGQLPDSDDGPQGAQSNPNNWYMLRRKAVRTVLNHAVRKTEFPFPPDLIRSIEAIDARPVTAAATNRQPLPPEIFRAVLDLCERRAAIDLDALPTVTNADNGRKAQAIIDKREGIQFAALLRLACQCALDNEDVSNLTWAHVKLDAKTPHIDFAREKPAWSTGQPISRKTPLLPQTVRALIRWRDYERPTDHVFRNASKGRWEPKEIGRVFKQLKTDAGHNSYWSFKHLRNVAPTVRRDAELPFDMSDTILGHAIRGTSRFYVGDADETYLLPLVRAVGNRYFAQRNRARRTTARPH